MDDDVDDAVDDDVDDVDDVDDPPFPLNIFSGFLKQTEGCVCVN